ncbi:MAG: ABC transporter ATP-binding protein/permease [Desulfotomaculum sp.]|nr:ABC transporter ATP-binding protein/permease [Desulfotomaculum sp.]MCL0080752.1 ABC transporter ATP-binding protein/permease [Peptococcaceae bacterium]
MFKKLFELYGAQSGLLYKTVLLKILEMIFLGSAFGVIYLTIRDLLAGTLSQQLAIYYVLAFLLCLVLAYTMDTIQKYALNLKEYLILAQERIKLGDHIRRLPMGFFNKKSAGELSHTLTESVRSIEFLPRIFGKSVGILVLAALFLVVLIIIDWRMTIAMFIAMPVAFYMLFKVMNMAETELLKRQDIQGRVSDAVVEYASGIKEVKTFGQSATSLKKYQQAITDFKEQNLKIEKMAIPKLVVYQLAVDIGFILVMILGAYLLIVRGDLSLALYLLFLMAALRLYLSFQELAGDTVIIKHGNAGLTRVNNIYENEPLLETTADRKIAHFDIEFNNVNFAYEQEQVLKNINFSAPANTITALIGPSGSGKTTITNLIARMWDIQEGIIKIGGINIKDVQTAELLGNISIVFQDIYLFNDTILNNIKMGKQDATKEEVIIAAQKANCHQFIIKFTDEYETMVGEGGGKLSGGEKQRISIARAFLKDAPVILLDEATANMDPENELITQNAINELVRDKTVIMISHKLSTIKAADQILVLDQGEIVQRGTHDQLIQATGIYSDYWGRREKAKGWKIAN